MDKKYFFSAITILLFLTLLNCGAKPEYGVKVEKEIYDFGTVNEGTDVKLEFVLKNIGKQILRIENVRPSCGCTAAENWDKEILPGKKGRIPITFRTRGYKDEVSKYVTITTNIPDRESIQLILKGVVKNPVSIEPGNVYLGNAETEPLSGSYLIKNNTDHPLNILEIHVPNERTMYTLETIEEGQEYRLNFTINPPFSGEEVVRDKFIIKTDYEIHPYYYPMFSYFLAPPVQVYPMKIMVNMAESNGTVIERRINIRSHIDQPIKILDVKSTGTDKLQFPVKEVNPGVLYQIAVRIPPDFIFPEDKEISILFKVENDPTETEYKIIVDEYIVQES